VELGEKLAEVGPRGSRKSAKTGNGLAGGHAPGLARPRLELDLSRSRLKNCASDGTTSADHTNRGNVAAGVAAARWQPNGAIAKEGGGEQLALVARGRCP